MLTISLGLVTSVVNLKRQDMHLYRASKSGPVQLYGIPCIGTRRVMFIFHNLQLVTVCEANCLTTAAQRAPSC